MKSYMKILLASVSFAFLLLSAIGAKAQNKVVREIDPFDKVVVNDNMNVVFIKSEKERITILAEGIGYDKIVTESSGRELKIKLKTGIYNNTKIDVEVEYVKLRSVEAGNKIDVKFNEPLTGDQLDLKATGGGVINVEVDVNALKANLSNGGRIEISGKTELQEVSADIGAKYNGYELESENGFIKSNTNADVVVWVKNKLEATAGSKAILKYRGKPAEVKSSTNLGGKISGDL